MRIFVKPLSTGQVTVQADEHHYLSRVRRARSGDVIELVDGEGQRARATIISIDDVQTTLRVDSIEAVPDLPPKIRVLVPLIKGDRMDTCLEKLVEVGADEIVLWPAARAVVRLEGERLANRVAHYQAAAQAAARQSGRASIPTVMAAHTLATALTALPDIGARVVLDPQAERGAMPGGAHVTLISGPEGGFSPLELDGLAAAKFAAVGLGPRVLRAETAPVVAVALLRAATQS